jgi:pheromone a factor receptor
MYRHREDLSQHLATRETPLTPKNLVFQLSRSAIQTLLLAILFVYSVSAEASIGLRPWPSWTAVHAQFSTVGTLSVSTTLNTERVKIELTWWMIPALSLVHIIFLSLEEICQGKRQSPSLWVRRLIFKEVDSGNIAMPAG